MLQSIIGFLFCIVLTETLTELITKSNIFFPVRKFFFDRNDNKLSNWIHDLLDCGYCTSVWMGWFTALLFLNSIHMIDKRIDWFFIGFVIHRLSNVLHNHFDNVYKGNKTDFNGQG